MRLRIPFRISLFLKVALLELLVVILTLLMGRALAVSILRQSLQQEAEEQLLLHAQTGAGELGRLMETGFTYIDILARHSLIASPETPLPIRQRELQQAQELFRVFEDIILIDREGRVLATTTYNYRGEWAAKEWFLQAREGLAVVSDAHIILDPFKAVVVYTAPLRDWRGEVWGVVAGQTNMERVWEIVKAYYPQGAGHAFLLNSRGQLIAHPLPSQLFQPWPGWEKAWDRGAPSGVRAIPQGGSPWRVAFFSVRAQPGRPLGWWLAVGQPEAWAYRTAESVQETLTIGMGVGGAALFLFTLLLGHRFLGPVRALVAGMRRVAGGDLEHRLPVTSQDEIGDLTATFNDMSQELDTKIKELAESRRRIVLAQEGVRQDIAGWLHGPVQTQLWALEQKLGEGQRLLVTDPQAAAQLLAQIRQELDSLREKDIRAISHQLHPAIIQMGLPAALRSLRDQFEEVMNIELAISPEVERLEDPAHPSLPSPLRLALFRCAQEALGNAIKHSHAQRVRMDLPEPREGWLRLIIEDDGVGFDQRGVKLGLGLISIQDYMGAVNGQVQLQTAPGRGTRITLRVPLGPGRGAAEAALR